MTDLTPEKRSELRRQWVDGTAPSKTIRALLDALDAKDAELQSAKAFAYAVGFSDGFARATNYAWIGPVPNNPYDSKASR